MLDNLKPMPSVLVVSGVFLAAAILPASAFISGFWVLFVFWLTVEIGTVVGRKVQRDRDHAILQALRIADSPVDLPTIQATMVYYQGGAPDLQEEIEESLLRLQKAGLVRRGEHDPSCWVAGGPTTRDLERLSEPHLTYFREVGNHSKGSRLSPEDLE